MRVIAGRLGGRSFSSPPGHKTHPMSDKMRGALFNVLGDINGLSVLDTFAGSGALSLEAISRGAKQAVAVDADKSAQKTIADNVAALKLDKQVQVIRAKVSAWLSTTDESFDIVLCDPPYDEVKPQLLEELANRSKQDGIVVLSLPPDACITLPDRYELLTRKDYGDASLRFYRKKPA